MMKLILLAVLVAVALARKVDVDDDRVQAAATQAAKELSKQFSGKFHHRLIRVITARTQDDKVYEMELVVGKTTCERADLSFEEVSNCGLQEGISTYKRCTVIVAKTVNGFELGDHGCILASKNDV